ncbi:MAG: hypothetical protein ACR652_18745 [Methylocystis sp.]|uniref:hypothetical protein n=1 Tax=Methylocystis sp. TaxID=1911079 RepID=UPI003DA5B703
MAEYLSADDGEISWRSWRNWTENVAGAERCSVSSVLRRLLCKDVIDSSQRDVRGKSLLPEKTRSPA